MTVYTLRQYKSTGQRHIVTNQNFMFHTLNKDGDCTGEESERERGIDRRRLRDKETLMRLEEYLIRCLSGPFLVFIFKSLSAR